MSISADQFFSKEWWRGYALELEQSVFFWRCMTILGAVACAVAFCLGYLIGGGS